MAKQLANSHDPFFKQALSDPELAGTFLREHLPAEVAELLGPEPLEPVPGSFVDEELREYHSDLLYRVWLKSGDGAFAYVLMEHKSTPDQGARLQMLRYVVRILSDWYEKNKKKLPLPPVLPLLAHQGPEGWRFSCEFADLFGPVPAALRRYLPDFQHALVDLSRIDDSDLSSKARLRAFLKALKYGRRPDLGVFIDVVLAESPELEKRDLQIIVGYLGKWPARLDNEMLRAALQRLTPERTEEIMGWIGQPYFDEGKAVGEAKGEAKVLARILEERFGAIPSSLRQRIFAADVASIDTWVELAFSAPDLQSVFESN